MDRGRVDYILEMTRNIIILDIGYMRKPKVENLGQIYLLLAGNDTVPISI